MLFEKVLPKPSKTQQNMVVHYRADEKTCVEALLKSIEITHAQSARINERAKTLVELVRKERTNKGGIDSFLYHYDLSSDEGIALMCLAEALLRVPDKQTIDKLIQDKLTSADWSVTDSKSHSMFVNAATWGLMLTGKVLERPEASTKRFHGALQGVVKRFGEPVIRKAVFEGMKILGKQFVIGETIKEAIARSKDNEKRGYRYSYDMLGEAALTHDDAERYFKSYQDAITAIGKAVAKDMTVITAPGISVKLSALHPRYEFAHRDVCVPALTEKLKALALQAKDAGIGLTVDAEEAYRLEISLQIIENVFSDPVFDGWEGFGLAVQAYQKRASFVLDFLIELSRKYKRRIMVRLVKGAYWDSEIKDSQVMGYEGYPVFTRKASTDLSYLVCAQKMVAASDAIYCQFATHNAHTVAAVMEMMGDRKDFEFQCLKGMGRTLYDHIVGPNKFNLPCRVYAPVGQHEDLLPYLVRRLLENGANSSFVNRIVDENAPIDEIIESPIKKVQQFDSISHQNIPLPEAIYGSDRKNSHGIDFTNMDQLNALDEELEVAAKKTWQAKPSTHEKDSGNAQEVHDPSDTKRVVGSVIEATEHDVEDALVRAVDAQKLWNARPLDVRSAILEKVGRLFETHRGELMALAVREAGKVMPDAIAEVREAVDFCYYYALQARETLAPQIMPGPTGEDNILEHHGRGVIACISPWNFPLAIFTGQITAALAAGNAVIAKPAEQTPLIAARAVELMHEAGVPKDVLQLMPGRGEIVGAKLVADPRVKGVVFTGSTETAQFINRSLAQRDGAIVPLIAETGGQNAMLVDSTALPEQLVKDVMMSSFYSAGQRCSALRVLFLQDVIADKVLTMLKGAMNELTVGDPSLLSTDIGPVIDDEALTMLNNHAAHLDKIGKLIHRVPVDSKVMRQGTFFAPCAYEIEGLHLLEREVFGPVLHVIRYKMSDLDKVIDSINATGYGLTLGIHTRIEDTAEYIFNRLHVGNTYVNRNMIGAVVGVQPFGGEGLSGTGPKAGGPNYLQRFCTERTLTINTTATGGNASLLAMAD